MHRPWPLWMATVLTALVVAISASGCSGKQATASGAASATASPTALDWSAVDQVIGVRVEQVDRRPGEDERDLVFAGDHAEPDAHRLVGAMRGARILRDDEDDRLGIGHGVN